MRKAETIQHDIERCAGKRQILRVAFQEFNIGIGLPGETELSVGEVHAHNFGAPLPRRRRDIAAAACDIENAVARRQADAGQKGRNCLPGDVAQLPVIAEDDRGIAPAGMFERSEWIVY